jgi:hypothetical protein
MAQPSNYQTKLLGSLGIQPKPPAVSPSQAFNQAANFAPPAPPPAPAPAALPGYSVQFGNMKIQFPNMMTPNAGNRAQGEGDGLPASNPTGLGPKGDRGVYTPTPAAQAYSNKMFDQLMAQSNQGYNSGIVHDMAGAPSAAARSNLRSRRAASDSVKNQLGRDSLLIQKRS